MKEAVAAPEKKDAHRIQCEVLKDDEVIHKGEPQPAGAKIMLTQRQAENLRKKGRIK